jgi:Cyclic nucleotide-binding domain
VSFADLGALAAESLACFLEDLDAAGIAADPALRLETTNGIVSYYDRSRAVISIATPGDSGPAAGLQRLAARSMLGLRDDRTLEELFRFAIPFTVAHELGHHLRHFHGRFGADLWHEEQVANMFASALQKRRYSPAERSEAAQFIAGVLEHLGSENGSNDAVVDSYGSLLAALDAAGLISEATLAGIALIEKYIPDDSTTGELLPVELLLRLEHRESVVEEFGQMYTSDVLRYVYYQLGWLVIAMSSRESLHLDTLARTHLRAGRLVLPPPAAVADEEHVRALGAAARHARTRSATGAAYFEFRYRDALLALLLESPDPGLRQAGAAARNLTSTTRSSDDVLDLVAPLLPTELRALLPAGLAASPLPEAAQLSASIPAGTDREMYEHVVLGADGALAAATLAQLEMLWAIELFDRLSPAALLPLCETVATVHVRGGQTIVWEGDNDLDIYCLQQGQVEVIDGDGSRVRLMGEGELFGEVQYLLRGGRSKTIRAVTPSVLVAVPERELSFLVHRHPETGLQIARTLARRLA